MGHKIIEEKGKYENGKQWVHLHKTNVKSRGTLTTPDKREILMWTGELLSKDDMEALTWQIDPQCMGLSSSLRERSEDCEFSCG